MTSHWVVFPLLVAAAAGQLYNNGYINPLFLPRSTPLAPLSSGRSGRLYDPWAADLRDNGLYLSGGGALRDRGLPYDSRFDDRRYPSTYDDLRRYPSRYDDLRRYPSRYDDLRRYPNGYDDPRYPSRYDELRRYLTRLDDYRRLPLDYRQYSDLPGVATTVRPEDRVQVLDRGQGLDRGQFVSTAAPDLAVTVQPNGSA